MAVDYNPTAQKVVEEGYNLAKMLKAEMCILHIMNNVQYYGIQYPSFMGFEAMNLGYDVEMHDRMRTTAKEFLNSIVKHLKDDAIHTHIVEGDVADNILEYAKEWGADIIVMGTHSHSMLEKMLMGTVASSVLERTSIPVHMVPVKGDK